MIWCWAALAGVGFPGQEHAFVSYGRVPTWTGVASALDGDAVQVDLYDSDEHRGHADFVSVGLGTGITFRQFKAAVKGEGRAYLPFFLYDLRGQEPTIAERGRTWAVRVEDYGYAPDDASLCRDVVRLAEAVSKHTGFAKADGVVVLARSERVRPNRACADGVVEAGWAHTTVSGLTVAPVPWEVLNPGVAIGTLRRVDPDAPLAVGPEDIAIYEALPERVPPVAGIVTLAPQTPLSHVNLLAQNRGTPNVHVASLAVLGAAPGDLVRLEAGDQLVVSPADEAARKAFQESRRPREVEVPAATREVAIRDFTEGIPTVGEVGAKASNYARLTKLLPGEVRPGHALTFGAYFAHAERSGAQAELDALLAELDDLDRAAVAERLAAIRAKLREAPVDPEVLAALSALLDRAYPGVRVRLRSSTNNEDLPTFNGAGLYTSKGVDPGPGRVKLEKKLKTVWASLWSEHAFAERAFYGVDHRAVGMGVLVHEAFPDEAANGVVLTVPREGGKVDVRVNAQPGEYSVANPDADTLPERLRFDLAAPGDVEVAGPSSIGPVFAEGFAAALLPELARCVQVVHADFTKRRAEAGDHAAYGVDLEWKLVHTPEGLKLFVKQARLLSAPAFH